MPIRPPQDLQQDMEHSKQIRTSDKQRLLHESYNIKLTALEGRLATSTAQSMEAATIYRGEKIARLASLVERKAVVETKIVETVREMRVRYEGMRAEFDVVVLGRLDDVMDGIGRVGALGLENGGRDDDHDDDGTGDGDGEAE